MFCDNPIVKRIERNPVVKMMRRNPIVKNVVWFNPTLKRAGKGLNPTLKRAGK